MSIAYPVRRGQLSPAIHIVRIASGPADAAIVRELDDAAFPPSSRDQQRAAPGELEDGVAVGDVYLLERDTEPVAYLHMDRQTPGRIYISGVAVRPDLQGHGLGSLLADHFTHSMKRQWLTTPVVSVTSPRNHVMLPLLFRRGFAARWLLRDFFGPGRDRFGCQLRTTSRPPGAEIQLVPVDELPGVFALMEEQHHVVRGLIRTAQGSHFLMSPEEPGEFLDCAAPE